MSVLFHYICNPYAPIKRGTPFNTGSNVNIEFHIHLIKTRKNELQNIITFNKSINICINNSIIPTTKRHIF